MALHNPSPGQEFLKYSTGAGTSFTGDKAFVKNLNTTNPTTGTSQATQDTEGSVVSFPPGVTSATFRSEMFVTEGRLDVVTDSLTQKLVPGTSVPDPLPLLGAGAAFGFSRKLRRRIKRAA